MLNRVLSSILTILLFAAAVLAPAVHAHESGHGQAIPGSGPHGGKLAPIIFAKDAELGSEAKTQAVAEWIKKDHVLEVYIWDNAKKNAFEITGPSEVKWILLGEKLRKPEVIKVLIASSQSRLTYSFAPDVMGKASKVEVILPNLGVLNEKAVVAFDL